MLSGLLDLLLAASSSCALCVVHTYGGTVAIPLEIFFWSFVFPLEAMLNLDFYIYR